MYIDKLEEERKITYHPVAKVKTQNGYIYVTAPPEQLAHKLSETIWISNEANSSRSTESIKAKYQKDIKDLSSMFYGFKDLYTDDEFLNRIYFALSEKVEETAYFSTHCPIYDKENIEQSHEILLEIMNSIIKDCSNYLETITEGKSDEGIGTFLNSLMARRALDVKKITRNEPTNGTMTPLQQREQQLSALEAEEKTISEAESLIIKQKEQERQCIGE